MELQILGAISAIVLLAAIILSFRAERRRARRSREEDDRCRDLFIEDFFRTIERKTQETPTVTFQGDVEVRPTACKVCGAKSGDDKIIHCARCGMSHHEDCWAYNGRCARYGCGHDKVA